VAREMQMLGSRDQGQGNRDADSYQPPGMAGPQSGQNEPEDDIPF